MCQKVNKNKNFILSNYNILFYNKQIKREIRLLKYFSHPNIIKLYEVLDSPTYIFVILELIKGGELFDLISRRGRLSENESRFLFI